MFTGGNATGQNYLDEIIELTYLHWNNMVYSETIQHMYRRDFKGEK